MEEVIENIAAADALRLSKANAKLNKRGLMHSINDIRSSRINKMNKPTENVFYDIIIDDE